MNQNWWLIDYESFTMISIYKCSTPEFHSLEMSTEMPRKLLYELPIKTKFPQQDRKAVWFTCPDDRLFELKGQLNFNLLSSEFLLLFDTLRNFRNPFFTLLNWWLCNFKDDNLHWSSIILLRQMTLAQAKVLYCHM